MKDKKQRSVYAKAINVFVLIAFLCILPLQSAQAEINIHAGQYSNFFFSGAFSLQIPEGFKKKKSKEAGVLFIHTKESLSLEIQCTRLNNADPEIFGRLQDEVYQRAFVQGLNRRNARQYNSWQLYLWEDHPVFQMTAIDEQRQFNPTRSLLFQKGDKEFLVTLGAETPARLDEYDYLLKQMLTALQI